MKLLFCNIEGLTMGTPSGANLLVIRRLRALRARDSGAVCRLRFNLIGPEDGAAPTIRQLGGTVFRLRFNLIGSGYDMGTVSHLF